MEDKTFDLMSKLYSEMNSKFDEMNLKFDRIDSRFDGIDKKLDKKADKNDIVRIEDKLENNSKALFDGYALTYEKLSDIGKKLEDIYSFFFVFLYVFTHPYNYQTDGSSYY